MLTIVTYSFAEGCLKQIYQLQVNNNLSLFFDVYVSESNF